jgi:hypothetical protein
MGKINRQPWQEKAYRQLLRLSISDKGHGKG